MGGEELRQGALAWVMGLINTGEVEKKPFGEDGERERERDVRVGQRRAGREGAVEGRAREGRERRSGLERVRRSRK